MLSRSRRISNHSINSEIWPIFPAGGHSFGLTIQVNFVDMDNHELMNCSDKDPTMWAWPCLSTVAYLSLPSRWSKASYTVAVPRSHGNSGHSTLICQNYPIISNLLASSPLCKTGYQTVLIRYCYDAWKHTSHLSLPPLRPKGVGDSPRERVVVELQTDWTVEILIANIVSCLIVIPVKQFPRKDFGSSRSIYKAEQAHRYVTTPSYRWNGPSSIHLFPWQSNFLFLRHSSSFWTQRLVCHAVIHNADTNPIPSWASTRYRYLIHLTTYHLPFLICAYTSHHKSSVFGIVKFLL